jgi:O-glycosyl hydrolase
MFRILGATVLLLSLACDGNNTTDLPAEVVPPAAAGPAIDQPANVSATVTINTAIAHQQMGGFGASMRIFDDPHLVAGVSASDTLQLLLPDQEAVLDSVYNTIGLTRVRALIQSNGSQPTPESTPRRDWIFGDGHIALVKRAETKGLREWWLSPLALETWMNPSTVSAYADWSMAEIRYWKSQGAELTWYSIANEPLLIGLPGEFLRDAVKLIGRQMAAEGIKTRLVIPDEVNPINGAERAKIVLSDPEARSYVGAIATHIYGTPLSAMSDIAAVSAQYNLPLWMSEFSVQDRSPMAWADIVHHLIADYNVSAVDYMWGFFGDWDPAQLVSIHSTSRHFTGASITPAGYAMAQYAKYVLPGAKRVELASSDGSILVTAFTLGGKITIVALNDDTSARAVRFVVGGASGLRNLNVVRTSDTENISPIGHVVVTGGGFSIELPARSISTFVQ